MLKIHVKKRKIVIFSPKLKLTLNYTKEGFVEGSGMTTKIGICHVWKSPEGIYHVWSRGPMVGESNDYRSRKDYAEKEVVEYAINWIKQKHCDHNADINDGKFLCCSKCDKIIQLVDEKPEYKSFATEGDFLEMMDMLQAKGPPLNIKSNPEKEKQTLELIQPYLAMTKEEMEKAIPNGQYELCLGGYYLITGKYGLINTVLSLQNLDPAKMV